MLCQAVNIAITSALKKLNGPLAVSYVDMSINLLQRFENYF